MKIAERFRKRRVEGTNYNPLILDEFQWDNEWVEMMSNDEVHPGDNLFWSHVDEATGASQSLRAPRVTRTYSRLRRGDGSSTSTSIHEQVETVEQGSGGEEDDEEFAVVADDLDIEDDYGRAPPTPDHDGAEADENEGGLNDIDLDVD